MMVFTGCGSKDGGAADSDGAAGGTVSTDGSTSMEKVIGGLAEAFEAANEGTTVTYNPTGSVPASQQFPKDAQTSVFPAEA